MLIIENEKLKAVKMVEVSGATTLSSINKEQLNPDKLVYELGKDGAATLNKFLDEIAHYKEAVSRMGVEMESLKAGNV